MDDVRARLQDELTRAEQQVASLEASFAQVVEASADSNADDEHDPEGATIAFERQQVVALLEQARASREELVGALARLDAGTYGVCERCGRPVAAERLEARPAARTCVACAR